MTPEITKLLKKVVANQSYPLLFVSLSGAHLYGFPSSDSDYDLRGSHCLPIRDMLSLDDLQETINFMKIVDSLELDLVTHDLKIYCQLLLKKNGNVLEQIMSPHIIHTTSEHEALKNIAEGCITSYFAHHYLGFSRNKWQEFTKQTEKQTKTLLYVYRVLLTGIHLMQSGQVEANLVRLNDRFKLPYITDLIAEKQTNGEKSILENANIDFHQAEYEHLTEFLEQSQIDSALPENPSRRNELNDWLISTRMVYGNL